MYFTSGSDRAFEQLMQTRPGADHFDNGEAGAPEDCGTCRFYRPHWKYQFCVYEECPYQPGKLTALDGAVKFQVKGVDDEMAVFRVEKNRGYTVMSNHHLRNKDLSLKAKGLLSQMLSLPESWDFTLKGLSLINREQIDAIRAAVRELEQAGYIVRSRSASSFLYSVLRAYRLGSFVTPASLSVFAAASYKISWLSCCRRNAALSLAFRSSSATGRSCL